MLHDKPACCMISHHAATMLHDKPACVKSMLKVKPPQVRVLDAYTGGHACMYVYPHPHIHTCLVQAFDANTDGMLDLLEFTVCHT